MLPDLADNLAHHESGDVSGDEFEDEDAVLHEIVSDEVVELHSQPRPALDLLPSEGVLLDGPQVALHKVSLNTSEPFSFSAVRTLQMKSVTKLKQTHTFIDLN